MLKFRLKPEVFRISLGNKMFDDSEFGDASKSERDKIDFEMFPLTIDLIEQINKDHTRIDIKTFVQDGRRKQEREEVIDNDKVNEDIIDKIIVKWFGVFDENGKEVPCNRENKLSMMRAYPRLAARWVEVSMNAMAKFDEYMNEKKETTRKNSKTSQSGHGEEEKI